MAIRPIPHVPEEEQELFLWMGFCLSFVQTAERSISQSLSYVFHNEALMTIRSLEAEEEAAARKKTLGQLLCEIRRRVDIDSDFDATLDSFLVHRNVFVHGLKKDGDGDKYETRTPEGRRNVRILIDALIFESWTVISVLMAAFTSFLEELTESNGGRFKPDLVQELRSLLNEARAVAAIPEAIFTRKG